MCFSDLGLDVQPRISYVFRGDEGQPYPITKRRLEFTIPGLPEGAGGELDEADKQRLREALMANRSLVWAGLALLLFTPLLIGAIVGYFTAAVRNGAVACGLGTIAVMLMTNQVLYGLVFGLIYAGLGALGSLVGRQLRRHRSRLSQPS